MTNQNQRVLNHLIDHGYITQVIANSYGIRRLASRINDLRNTIPSEIHSQMRTDDAGVRYAYYSMADAERNFERTWRDECNCDYRVRPLAPSLAA